MNGSLLLVDSTIRVSAILAAALVATAFLGRRSAALRHFVLATAIACALAAPLATVVVPPWNVGLNWAWIAQPPRTSAPPAGEPSPAVSAGVQVSRPIGAGQANADPSAGLASVLFWIWAGGAAIMLARLLTGLARLAWLSSQSAAVTAGAWPHEAGRLARDLRLRRRVRIRQSTHPTLLVAYGVLRPTVLLPRTAAGWSGERVQIVLAHELAHIAAGDWFMGVAAEVLRAIYWFNPLAWIAGWRFRQEGEQACDDAVLRAGTDGCEYAAHLIAFAREFGREREAGWPAPAMARTSSLERRITAMIDSPRDRRALTRRIRLATILLFLGLAAPIVMAQGRAPAALSGVARDVSGRPVPGVVIVVTNAAGGVLRAKTAEDGRYEFAVLGPGQYDFVASLPGFKVHRAPLFLNGRSPVKRDVALALGSLAEELTITGSAASAARPAEPPPVQSRSTYTPPPCVNQAAGGDIKEPRKVLDVRPRYPSDLIASQVAGVVVLKGIVTKQGGMRGLTVLSEAHPGLSKAAIEAVSQWQFTPTLLNCEPVEVEVTVTINFTLGG